MSVVRYRSGGSTVTLSMPRSLEVRAVLERAMGGALKAIEEPMEALAAEARREWYGPNGVTKETGKSGDIQVVTTIDAGRDTVTVSIGSTDDRVVKGRVRRVKSEDTFTGKPLPVYVHQPWSTSGQPEEVPAGGHGITGRTYWGWKRRGLPVLPPPTDAWWSNAENGKGLTRGKWYILVPGGDPKATPSRTQSFLLERLVKKPARKLAKTIGPDVARAIAQAVNRG